MGVMFNLRAKPTHPPMDGKSLKRLELEMALEIGDTGGRPMAERLRDAAKTAGADLLFVLPVAYLLLMRGFLIPAPR